MASKQPSDNTNKNPSRAELSDSTKKLGKLTINVKKTIGEEKKDLIETQEVEDNGQIVARYVKKDGKVLESSATPDMQSTGNHEKAAKKAGVKEDDILFTTPSMNAASAEVKMDDHDDFYSEDAKLFEKTKEVKPKKTSESEKPDNSLLKQAGEKTGMADKDGDRDLEKDIKKNLKKADKITDISKTKAFEDSKAKEQRDSMANTMRMVDLVKKLTEKKKADYNPANASAVAQQIRDLVAQKQQEGPAQPPEAPMAPPTPIKPVLAKGTDNGDFFGKIKKKPSAPKEAPSLDYKEMNKIKQTKEGPTIDYSKMPPPPDQTPNWKKKMDAQAPKPAVAPTPKGVIIKKPEQKAKGVILKKDMDPAGVASLKNAFGGAPSAPSAPAPTVGTGSIGSAVTNGLNSLMGKADDKWPVPGIVPPKSPERHAIEEKKNPHTSCLSFLQKACGIMRGGALEKGDDSSQCKSCGKPPGRDGLYSFYVGAKEHEVCEPCKESLDALGRHPEATRYAEGNLQDYIHYMTELDKEKQRHYSVPKSLEKGDVVDFKSAQDKKAKDAGYFDHKTKMTIDASKKDPELNALLHTPLGQHPSDSDYTEQKPKVKTTKEQMHAQMNAKMNKKPISTDEKIANAMALQNQPKPKKFGKISLEKADEPNAGPLKRVPRKGPSLTAITQALSEPAPAEPTVLPSHKPFGKIVIKKKVGPV
jgi:hypothetical protein